MSLNDKAVLTAAKGYMYTAPIGTKMPTKAEVDSFNPDKFGATGYDVSPDTAPTGGTYTIEYDGETTGGIKYNAAAGTVQDALRKLTGVPDGTFLVEGDPISDGSLELFVFGEGVPTVDGTNLDGSTGVVVTETTEANGWNNIGHTSRGTLPDFGSEGGDTEVKGTWQNESLREVESESLVEHVTFTSNQMSEDSLVMYYGRNAASEPGVFGVAGGTRTPVERAFLVVIVDGDVNIANYAPKVSIKRDDSIGLSTDDFTNIPLKATYLKFGNKNLFRWVTPFTGVGGSGKP